MAAQRVLGGNNNPSPVSVAAQRVDTAIRQVAAAVVMAGSHRQRPGKKGGTIVGYSVVVQRYPATGWLRACDKVHRGGACEQDPK